MFFKVIIHKKSFVLVPGSSTLVLKTLDVFNLNDIEMLVMEYIQKNSTITNKKAVEITELSDRGMRKVLSKLQEKNLIEAKGNERNRYYVLKN